MIKIPKEGDKARIIRLPECESRKEICLDRELCKIGTILTYKILPPNSIDPQPPEGHWRFSNTDGWCSKIENLEGSLKKVSEKKYIEFLKSIKKQKEHTLQIYKNKNGKVVSVLVGDKVIESTETELLKLERLLNCLFDSNLKYSRYKAFKAILKKYKIEVKENV